MSENAIEIATNRILAPAGLDEQSLGRLLSGIMGHAVDSADLCAPRAARRPA